MQKSLIQISRLAPYKTFFQKKKPGYLQMFLVIGSFYMLISCGCLLVKIVHNAHDNSYEKLFVVSIDITVHQKHLRLLAIEVYKSLMKISSDFMWDSYTIFTLMIYALVKSPISPQLTQHVMA